MHAIRIILLIFMILIPAYFNLAFAEISSTNTEIFPKACKAFALQGEDLHLHAGNLRMLMVHNLSAYDVWMTHAASDENFDPGWSSRLQGNQWSALALDKTELVLNCIESKPGHEQQIACERVLAVCEWPITSRPKDTHGVFWAGENMALTALTAYIGRHGFELPPEAQ